MLRFRIALICAVVLSLCAVGAFAMNAGPMRAAAPAARATFVDVGRAAGTTAIDDAMLFLPLAPEADARLQKLLADQLDPASSRYHKWITPEEFGQQFGAAQSELDSLLAGMRAQGLRPATVARSHGWVRFSGQASDIERAFGMQVRRMQADSGEERLHIAANPSAKTATAAPLSRYAAHVFLPDDLRANASQKKVVPLFTSSGSHYLVPGDFATIYNVNAIYNAGYKGADSNTTVNIAVVGQSEIDLNDVAQFRKQMNLAANAPTVTNVGVSPGKTGDEMEGDLDVEWAGAIAPQSNIRYYVAKAAGQAAAQAVDDNFSSILSVSFGICEPNDQAEASAYSQLFAQAASQGVSVFVSSGDSGAAGCNGMSESVGSGQAVNIICTGNTTCVGGTQFADTSNPAAYWNSTNDATTFASAKGYIPEVAWNESGTNGLASSGGGVSTLFSRPPYQTSFPGMPAGTTRCQPDIAANAGHVPYIIYSKGQLSAVVGTSASAPSVAATIGLIRQRLGRLGLVNTTLYQLAAAQFNGGGSTIFHDITSGSNSVPGVTGYNAGPGYDLVTGLGSFDAGALMNAMAGSGGTPAPSVCSPNTTTACVLSNRFQVKVRYRNGFDNNPVDTDALVRVVPGFAGSDSETVFFYFNSPSNLEMMAKLLDQGSQNSSGQRTIAVLYGTATPLRIELTITDTTNGAVKQYTSAFGSQTGGTDFLAFIK